MHEGNEQAHMRHERFSDTEEEFEKSLASDPSYAVIADFYREILKTKKWNTESLGSLKRHLAKKFMSSQEEIHALADTVQFLYRQRELDAQKASRAYTYNPGVSRDFAEHNYLVMHFFTALNQPAAYGETFWNSLARVARHLRLEKELAQTRAGIMGQVAVYKALRAIGEKPQFSLPRDDVDFKVDLWDFKNETERNAFQIKTSGRQERGVILEESEWLAFPSARVSPSASYEQHFIEESFRKMSNFSVSVKKYARAAKKNVRAWYVSLPTRSINYATGEVSADIIEELRRKMRVLPQGEK